MDATDVRLLRAMYPRLIGGASAHPADLRAAALARVVGLSVNAVKARVAKLEADGLLRGHACFPSLAALELQGGAFLARSVTPRASESLRRELSARGRLLRLHDYAGGHLCVEMAYASARERAELLEIVRHASGGAEPQLWLDLDGHAPSRPLSPLDWRIVAAVRRDPLATPMDVARAAGVSARTVKRRLDRLVEEGALWTMPRLDAARAAGLLLVEMLFTLEPGHDATARAAILRAFDVERVWAFEPASHAVGHFDILAVARSTAEVEELRQRGEALPHVERVEALFFLGSDDHSEWVDRLIADRCGARPSSPTALSAGPVRP